jgi:hypothetical protein
VSDVLVRTSCVVLASNDIGSFTCEVVDSLHLEICCFDLVALVLLVYFGNRNFNCSSFQASWFNK